MVLPEQVVNGEGLLAGGAEASGAVAGAGSLAVVAPLLAQVALRAVGAAADGDVTTGSPVGHDPGEDSGGDAGGGVLAGAPGGLPAGRSAVPLAADPGEAGVADRAATGRGRAGRGHAGPAVAADA